MQGDINMPSAEEKLDRLINQVQDLRIEFTGMRGDLRQDMTRIDSHDARAQDVEARLRVMERRLWSIPGFAALMAAASLAVAVWSAFNK